MTGLSLKLLAGAQEAKSITTFDVEPEVAVRSPTNLLRNLLANLLRGMAGPCRQATALCQHLSPCV